MVYRCLTVESVSEGHPDKVCDQIAEHILDYCLKHDSNAHVACEVFVTQKHLFIGGEITSVSSKINVKSESFNKQIIKIARDVITKIGYNQTTWIGFDQLEIKNILVGQSGEIEHQVKQNSDLGIGDNTIVFGFATCFNHINLFPIQQLMANLIMQKISQIRKSSQNQVWNFAPDGKIAIDWEENVVKNISLSQQFIKKPTKDRQKTILENQIFQKIILPLLQKYDVIIEPTKTDFNLIPFQQGGPAADSGLTGRKIIVDAYGVFAHHGGGSYIGKDPTKGDLSLALYARYIAKHLVYAKVCPEVEIKISALIGQKTPFNIVTNLVGKQKTQVQKILKTVFNWNLSQIIGKLHLNEPQFAAFASYGFFGRTKPFQPTWEKIDSKIITQINKKI